MILIADGGSTKTSWCLIGPDNNQTYFQTEGYNPYYVTSDYIVASIKKTFSLDVLLTNIESIHFYGAGCGSGYDDTISDALHRVFPVTKIFIGSDQLAAARALLGNKTGFAAILGTGTNTCLYNGNEIILNIDSLGYMLGDEGSGSYIGKKFLSLYLRGEINEELQACFLEMFKLSNAEILNSVYMQPLPNRFCAGFSKFIHDNLHYEVCQEIVNESFRDFFANLVSKYRDYNKHTFNCVGSIAYYFRDNLAKIASEFDMEIGIILINPIERLASYHYQNYNLTVGTELK